MTSNMDQFTAIIDLPETDTTATVLKQAALLFDHIYYVPPTRFTWVPQGGPMPSLQDASNIISVPPAFWFRDILPNIAVPDGSIQNAALRDTVLAFREAGIISPAAFAPGGDWLIDARTTALRQALGNADIADPTFLEAAGSARVIRDGHVQLIQTHIRNHDGASGMFHLVSVCHAIAASWALTHLAVLSHRQSSYPLIFDPLMSFLLRKRLARSPLHSKLLPESSELLATSARLSAVDLLVPSDVVQEMSPKDILDMRARFNNARQDLFANQMIQLEHVMRSSSSEEALDTAMRHFRSETLLPALKRFAAEQKSFRDRWIGRVTTRAFSAASMASAGYLANAAIPGSMLSGFLAAVMGGIVKDGPGVAKDLIEFTTELRARNRCGLSYFLQLQSYRGSEVR